MLQSTNICHSNVHQGLFKEKKAVSTRKHTTHRGIFSKTSPDCADRAFVHVYVPVTWGKKASAWVLVGTEGSVTVTPGPFVFRQLPEMKKIVMSMLTGPRHRQLLVFVS